MKSIALAWNRFVADGFQNDKTKEKYFSFTVKTEEHGYELSNDMTAYLHELDHIRYVTNGINGVFAAGNRLIQAFSDITGEEAPDALMKGDRWQ